MVGDRPGTGDPLDVGDVVAPPAPVEDTEAPRLPYVSPYVPQQSPPPVTPREPRIKRGVGTRRLVDIPADRVVPGGPTREPRIKRGVGTRRLVPPPALPPAPAPALPPALPPAPVRQQLLSGLMSRTPNVIPAQVQPAPAPSVVAPSAAFTQNPMLLPPHKRPRVPQPPVAAPQAPVSVPSVDVVRQTRLLKADQYIRARGAAIQTAFNVIKLYKMSGRKLKGPYNNALASLRRPIDVAPLLVGLSGPDVDALVSKSQEMEKIARDRVISETGDTRSDEAILADLKAEAGIAPDASASDILAEGRANIAQGQTVNPVDDGAGTGLFSFDAAQRNPPLPPSPFGKAVRKSPGEVFGPLPNTTRRKGGLRKKKLRTRRGIQQNVRRSRSGKNRSDRSAANSRRRS
jgi:hypothetical protein